MTKPITVRCRRSADYSDRINDVIASICDGANDGEAGEGDNIACDVEDIPGGDGDNTLTGDVSANLLEGGKGNDWLYGDAGHHDIRAAGDPTFVDHVACGGDSDAVTADPADIVDADCLAFAR